MLPELAAVAARNGGPFSRAQALSAGCSSADVRRQLSSGRWIAVRKGIYVAAEMWHASKDRPTDRHSLEVAAAALTLRADAVGSHRSAALLHGFEMLSVACEVTVTCSPKRGRVCASYGGLRVRVADLPAHHRGRVAHSSSPRLGVPVTSAARTVVDVSRSLTRREAVVAADSALRLGTTSVQELGQVLLDCWTWPGIRRAATVVGFADPRAESALESLGRLVFAEQRLPTPRTQVHLGDADGPIGRVDFYWEEYGVVGEADGLGKYATRDVLIAEKLRQERLEEAGYIVVRFTWDDLMHRPAETAQRVRRAFARAVARRAR